VQGSIKEQKINFTAKTRPAAANIPNKKEDGLVKESKKPEFPEMPTDMLETWYLNSRICLSQEASG
jgi:hypothetical protein